MFNHRALATFVVRLILFFALILSGLANVRPAVAQELSPSILQTIPRVVERLHSSDIYERISVLDELVIQKRTAHLPHVVLAHNFPASDYSVVVKSILSANLEQLDERRASETWWRLTYVVEVFKLKELVKPIAGYLPKTAPPIQLTILWTLRTLGAVESVPQIVTLLRSPEEYIRREALEVLVSLRSKAAVPSLVAMLSEKDEIKRYHAITNLVKVNGREAAANIAKILEDEHENNRYWALDALVTFNAREHAQAIWKLTEAHQHPNTQRYALAALIYFGDRRAIPLAVEKATEADLSPRLDMMEFLVKVKATAIAPAFVAVLESSTILGGNPSDTGTDSNIRRDIMTCLGQLGSREAIPVLRRYARGIHSNTFLQDAAVMTLGVLGAKESVDDLLLLLDKPDPDYKQVTAEVGLALAQIGEQRTWRKLIDLAARPSCRYRSEIISELNRHLDRELWERIQKQKVSGLLVKSVDATTEAFARESGIRIVLDYQPGRDLSLRAPLKGDKYPWANTSVEKISLSYGLGEIIDGLSDSRIPRTFTFIFDDKEIRILSVERAIEWWRQHILSGR
jgi:HEAT repeat protein